MITSENIVPEAQFKNFSISWKNLVMFFIYSVFSILNHFIKFVSCDDMMSISTLGRVRLNTSFAITHLAMKLGRLIDIVIGNIFEDMFHDLKDIVYIGVSNPLKNTTPSKPPLKSANCSSPPF